MTNHDHGDALTKGFNGYNMSGAGAGRQTREWRHTRTARSRPL
jgi:hypothetical protein